MIFSIFCLYFINFFSHIYYMLPFLNDFRLCFPLFLILVDERLGCLRAFLFLEGGMYHYKLPSYNCFWCIPLNLDDGKDSKAWVHGVTNRRTWFSHWKTINWFWKDIVPFYFASRYFLISSLIYSFYCSKFFQFSSVAQSCLTLCDPWITARQASLSITNSWSSHKLMSIESVMGLCSTWFLPLTPVQKAKRDLRDSSPIFIAF